ncbi:uncharacterized protein LOC131667840 [Phymastichus coffea]|uniref:uncharacterized protein LOC131667840 n=1 Tax=Phymastichus coffea TaxID=108790 RepID=UPI00273AA96B|nr:uncharacterized protein LOC131667840 [Phymastichus coffea]
MYYIAVKMSSSKSYIQYLAAVLLISVCLFEQASARICYSCDSDKDYDCISRPNQDKFAVVCTAYTANAKTSELSDSNTEELIGSRAVVQDCATAIGISTIDGSPRTVRGCSIPSVTCATYQIIYAAKFNLQVNKCLRCNSDACNFRNY